MINKFVKIYEPVDDTRKHLVSSDIYCLLSIGEGFPLGLLEAMSCGIPVVTSQYPPFGLSKAEGGSFLVFSFLFFSQAISTFPPLTCWLSSIYALGESPSPLSPKFSADEDHWHWPLRYHQIALTSESPSCVLLGNLLHEADRSKCLKIRPLRLRSCHSNRWPDPD